MYLTQDFSLTICQIMQGIALVLMFCWFYDSAPLGVHRMNSSLYWGFYVFCFCTAKKYNDLFPKEKKEKARKSGSEVKEEGKGKKKQPSVAPKKEPEPAAQEEQEEEEDAPKPAKFCRPLC